MLRKSWGKILLLLILIAGALFISLNPSIYEQFKNTKNIRSYVQNFQILAPVIFIILYTVRTLLFVFPVAIFAILSGSLFGFGMGYLYSMIGAFLSATVAFYIGRYLARDLVEKSFSDKMKMLKRVKIKGFSLMFCLRIIMVMPYDALSYIVGLTKITYKEFILGNMAGIALEFLMYSYLGFIGFDGDLSLREKVALSLGIILLLIIIYISKKIFIKVNEKRKIKSIRIIKVIKYKMHKEKSS